MTSCLVGHTGFIGSNLLSQRKWDFCVNRSTEIHGIPSEHFDLCVCAGAPGTKWGANAEPIRDRNNITALIELLSRISARRWVLISTADVFGQPVDADETGAPNPDCPYGRERFRLEEQFHWRGRNCRCQIVRLPGVVGPGLKKGPIFDLTNEHRLEYLNPESVYQFYDVRNLWRDIEHRGEKIIHLVAKPERLGEVVARDFPNLVGRIGAKADKPVKYNLRTIYPPIPGR